MKINKSININECEIEIKTHVNIIQQAKEPNKIEEEENSSNYIHNDISNEDYIYNFQKIINQFDEEKKSLNIPGSKLVITIKKINNKEPPKKKEFINYDDLFKKEEINYEDINTVSNLYELYEIEMKRYSSL